MDEPIENVLRFIDRGKEEIEKARTYPAKSSKCKFHMKRAELFLGASLAILSDRVVINADQSGYVSHLKYLGL
jgi:hypothetical protein